MLFNKVYDAFNILKFKINKHYEGHFTVRHILSKLVINFHFYIVTAFWSIIDNVSMYRKMAQGKYHYNETVFIYFTVLLQTCVTISPFHY